MTEEVSKEQIKGENGTGIDEAKRLKEKKGAGSDGICTGNEPEQFRSRRLFIRERSTL